jgi:hypothetical protein
MTGQSGGQTGAKSGGVFTGGIFYMNDKEKTRRRPVSM